MVPLYWALCAVANWKNVGEEVVVVLTLVIWYWCVVPRKADPKFIVSPSLIPNFVPDLCCALIYLGEDGLFLRLRCWWHVVVADGWWCWYFHCYLFDYLHVVFLTLHSLLIDCSRFYSWFCYSCVIPHCSVPTLIRSCSDLHHSPHTPQFYYTLRFLLLLFSSTHSTGTGPRFFYLICTTRSIPDSRSFHHNFGLHEHLRWFLLDVTLLGGLCTPPHTTTISTTPFITHYTYTFTFHVLFGTGSYHFCSTFYGHFTGPDSTFVLRAIYSTTVYSTVLPCIPLLHVRLFLFPAHHVRYVLCSHLDHTPTRLFFRIFLFWFWFLLICYCSGSFLLHIPFTQDPTTILPFHFVHWFTTLHSCPYCHILLTVGTFTISHNFIHICCSRYTLQFHHHHCCPFSTTHLLRLTTTPLHIHIHCCGHCSFCGEPFWWWLRFHHRCSDIPTRPTHTGFVFLLGLRSIVCEFLAIVLFPVFPT